MTVDNETATTLPPTMFDRIVRLEPSFRRIAQNFSTDAMDEDDIFS
jgi:hypothetical protein